MEYCLYKQKRDEMIKFLFNTGSTVGQISGRLAIDEDLVRSVLKIKSEDSQLKINSIGRHPREEVKELYYNFLTDPDIVLITKCLSNRLESSNLKEILSQEQYEREVENRFLK